MIDTLKMYESAFSTIEDATRAEDQFIGNRGKKATKCYRKRLYQKLADSYGISRQQFLRQIRNKLNGVRPSLNGHPSSYLAMWMLRPTIVEPTLRFDEFHHPEDFLFQFHRIAKHYGYSYGGAVRPSMCLQIQRCQSFSLEQKLLRLTDLLQEFLNLTVARLDDEEVQRVLLYKAPKDILRGAQLLTSHQSLRLYRPDIVVTNSGQLKITELESAPGGLGIHSVHEVATSGQSVLAERFAGFLDGKSFRVVVCPAWIDYVWELAAFCKVLRQHYNVDARVIITTTPAEMADHFRKWRSYNGVKCECSR